MHNNRIEKLKKSKNNSKIEHFKCNRKGFNPNYMINSKSRSVRTRGYAKLIDNEEYFKVYKLCIFLKDIINLFYEKYNSDTEISNSDVFTYFKENLKTRTIKNDLKQNQIDLDTIQRHASNGKYTILEQFLDDLHKLIANTRQHFKLNEKNKQQIDEFENYFNNKLEEQQICEIDTNEQTDQDKDQTSVLDNSNSFENYFEKKSTTILSTTLRTYLAAITGTSNEMFNLNKLQYKIEVNWQNTNEDSNSVDYNLISTENGKLDSRVQELQPMPLELPNFKKQIIPDDEEIIRCICSMNRDEGTMIQCDKCMCWQHAECMRADIDADIYLCEKCNPRDYSREVKYEKTPADAVDGWQYYLTFLNGDLLVRQGDCVYLDRDKGKNCSEQTSVTSNAMFTDMNGNRLLKSEVDIFKIERLYTDAQGKKFIYGHHCLRPSETFHEPNRKFFSNEVLSSPLGGSAPLEAVKGICYVLDLSTFCKGRPIGAKEEDIYICEYKVCKRARSFSKIAKGYFAVNTKSYCFNYFEERLHPKRTFSPHDVSMFQKDKKYVKSTRSKEERKTNITIGSKICKNNSIDSSKLYDIHLKAFVQKQFNINKIVDKITTLDFNEENED